jgi:RNA polymerase sigma-70 factor (ECF subfamily)
MPVSSGRPPATFDGEGGDADGLDPADRLRQAVDAAARGEEAGWNVLFDRFYRVVHAYAMARLGDPAVVEEVAQEVFVAAVGSIGGLRERREPAVEAWFLRICRHKVIDHVRRAARQGRERGTLAPPPVDPGEVVDAMARAAELREAMQGLSEDQRDVLVRRFVLDQSIEEVAGSTGRSAGAVKSLQHRALAALGRLLGRSSAA